MKRRTGLALALTVASLGAAGAAQAAASRFSTDVSTAIDRGLAWMANSGAYNATSSAGNAAGLAAIALLEKRVSADQNAAQAGYANATAADKTRIQNVITYIINNHTNQTFYAYRDGANLMALSVYLRTGGPSQASAQASIRTIFDRVRTNQSAAGYWCYSNGGCNDSSTTQLVMAGLAAAKAVFTDPNYADATRAAQLDTLVTKTANAYASNGTAGEMSGSVGVLEASERGHAYQYPQSSYYNSLPQTASGLWGQIVGGKNLNDTSVQAYLRWLRNRYRYTDISATLAGYNIGGPWYNSSYTYYLWSASKAFTYLEDSNVVPNPGNLSPDDIGVLSAASAPAFAGRQVHTDLATATRPAAFGAGGAGYYNDGYEPNRWYVDFAYRLIAAQAANGDFSTGMPGRWESYSSNAYAILVLERSVGGGCADTDGDGLCDSEDNCAAISNANQADADGDHRGDVCDNCVSVSNQNQADADHDGIGDACDNCPSTANPGQGNGDGDAFGDACDECPAVAAGANPDPAHPGCPSNHPPVADARPDGATYECTSSAGAAVTLDGTHSSDPDHDALSFAWAPAAGLDNAAADIAHGTFALGAHSLTLTVDDGQATDDDGASFTVVDTTGPSLTCASVTAECSSPVGTPVAVSASASDVCDADVSAVGAVPALFPYGASSVSFSATDDSGNSGSCTAGVNVVDTTPPTLTLNGGDLSLECGAAYVEPGATATDVCFGDLPVSISGSVTTSSPGTYTVSYDAVDGAGLTANDSRDVTVLHYWNGVESVLWHQPIARNGMSDDTDPSLQADGNPATNLKYRFQQNNTIPVQIHLLDKWGNDVTAAQSTSARVTVYTDVDCDGAVEAGDASVAITYNGVGGVGGQMVKVSDSTTGETHLKYNLNTKSLPLASGCFVLEVTSVVSGFCNDSASERVLLQRK